MKLPRDVSGADLVKALGRVGYNVTRQAGSYVRLTTDQPAPHNITVPAHDPLKVGTLAALLGVVATFADRPRRARAAVVRVALAQVGASMYARFTPPHDKVPELRRLVGIEGLRGLRPRGARHR